MIRSLQLRNFKCFKSQSIDFAPLTLLSGLNGMGKSSVLQALLLLRQSYERKLLPDTGLALNGDLVQIGTTTDAFFRYICRRRRNQFYRVIGQWLRGTMAPQV